MESKNKPHINKIVVAKKPLSKLLFSAKIDKMKSILSHIGAWAPKAEQLATARYLSDLKVYDDFIAQQNQKIKLRLQGFYDGLMKLKQEGFPLDAVSPQAAMYLTVCFNLQGKKTPDGKLLSNTKDVTAFLLNEAKLAIVPFYAFGTSEESKWYRLSVGTCSLSDLPIVLQNIKSALSRLS